VTTRANRFEAERLAAQQQTSEPKAKIVFPVYIPLKLETCKKCMQKVRKDYAEPKELIKITRKEGNASS
jgi:hypothetical protein